MDNTTPNNLTPDIFKQKVMTAHPEYAKAVANDGTPYSTMDATDFTKRLSQKYPDAVTKDGHKYSDYLPKTPTPDSPVQEQHGSGLAGFGGALVSGLVKPFARLGTNLIQAGEIATGNKTTTPFSGKFLGDVQPVGMANGGGLSVQNLKDSVGTGLDLSSYLMGGGGAKAGIESLKAGELLAKQFTKTVAKTALQGAGIGATSGVGKEMQNPNSTAGSIATQGVIGGAVGGVTGGLLGAGGQALEKTGLLNKAFGATDNRVVNAMQDVRAGYEEAMQKNKKTIGLMQKDDALGKDTIGDLLDRGIITNFSEDGTRLDTSKGMQQIEASNDLFKPALGQAIQEENKQVLYSDLEKQLVSQLGKYKNTADEGAIVNELQGRLAQFKRNGDITDLVNMQDIKNKASADSVGMYNPLIDASTSIKKKAAKELFNATKTLIKKNVAKDSPVNQINSVLETNHRMSDVLDVLNNSTVKRGKLGKYVTEMAGGAVGNIIGGLGGIPGQIFGTLGGAKVGDMVAEFVMKNSLGSNASRTLLESLQKTDNNLYQQVIQKIKENATKKAGMLKLPSPSFIPAQGRTYPQGGASVLEANKNPVSVNPKTNKFQTTYNSAGLIKNKKP